METKLNPDLFRLLNSSQQRLIEMVMVTEERAGHAFDSIASIGDQELNLYDGVVAVVADELVAEFADPSNCLTLPSFLEMRYKA